MAQWKPKRVRNESERGGSGSGYIQLVEGEKFFGYALFEADPTKDDPGYYEFKQHWVPGLNGKGGSVPCADEDCPICEDEDKPRDVANTLWVVTQDEKGTKLGNDGEGELRIFKANSVVIKQFTDFRSEGEKIKGVQFKVSRLDDRGNYTLIPKAAEPLKAAEIKAWLAKPEAPDFDKMVTSQLNKVMEAMSVSRAVNEDDDDEDDKPSPSRSRSNGKAKTPPAKPKQPKIIEWPEDGLTKDEVAVIEVDPKGDYIDIVSVTYDGAKRAWTTDDIEFDLTTLAAGEVVILTTGPLDEDGEYIITDEPVAESREEADEEDDNDLPAAVEAVVCIVKEIDSAEGTMELQAVEDDELAFTLYFLEAGPASEVDFDDYKEGDKITVSAEKDPKGDLVATEVPTIVADKKPRGKAAATATPAAARKGKTA